jgi:hypothetical protein
MVPFGEEGQPVGELGEGGIFPATEGREVKAGRRGRDEAHVGGAFATQGGVKVGSMQKGLGRDASGM